MLKVSLASENEQRELAKELETPVVSEMVPFTFSVDGREQIKEAPFVFVPHLINHVKDLLSHHHL